jgi:hypothetical protein
MMYESFSSLPPHEEQQFVVFEQRTAESAKKAMTVGVGVAGSLFLVILVVVIAFWGPLKEFDAPAEDKPAASAPKAE